MPTDSSTQNKLQRAERRLASERRKREEMELAEEEAGERGTRILMTMAQDVAEEAGAAVVGELAAADLPINGEHIGIAAGAIAQAFRPFTDPLGVGRLITSPFQGMITGGLAIGRFRSALKRKGKTIAPAVAP